MLVGTTNNFYLKARIKAKSRQIKWNRRRKVTTLRFHTLQAANGDFDWGLHFKLSLILRMKFNLEFVVAMGELGALHTFFRGGRDLMNSKIMAWASFLTRGGISPFTITLRSWYFLWEENKFFTIITQAKKGYFLIKTSFRKAISLRIS